MDELRRSETGFQGILKRFGQSKADQINEVNRHVMEFQPAPVQALFDPRAGLFNAVISGGSAFLRNEAILAQTVCARQNNYPVIILHAGNHGLEDMMREHFGSSNQYGEVSLLNPSFEPFYQLTLTEITNQIFETASRKYGFKDNLFPYIEGLGTYLKILGKHLTLQMLCKCPHNQMPRRINEEFRKGTISLKEASEIKAKLKLGQSEIQKLDSFLQTLKLELKDRMYLAKKGIKPINILAALQSYGVVCIDVGSLNNHLFLDTIIYQLKLANTKRARYHIVFDDIRLSSNDLYIDYVKSSSDRVSWTFSSPDLFMMLSKDETTFSMINTDSDIQVILRQHSLASAKKWAETFGYFERLEETRNQYRRNIRRNTLPFFSVPVSSTRVTIKKKRDFIIGPEDLTHLENQEAYIYSAPIGGLGHLYLVSKR